MTHRLGQVAAFLDAIVDSVDGATVRLSPGDPAARATRVLALGEENRVWVSATNRGDGDATDADNTEGAN